MKKISAYELTTCALMAALMCILGPMSVPIGPVPVSLTNLVIYISVYLIGTRGSLISFLVYVLLGVVGLPVFSGYQGGVAKVAGPTGGYIVGFVFMVLITGIFMEKSKANIWITFVGMLIGTFVTYLFGTIWFCKLMEMDFTAALGVCVFPFIPFDLIKMVVASILGKTVRTALVKAGLLKGTLADADK